jgi:hypothetical protein
MTDLEEIIMLRLDGLTEALAAVHADVKRLLDAPSAPPEPILEPVDAGWLCQWPDCGIEVSIDQAELSSRWCNKVLCSQHNVHLKAIREAKKAAAG